MNNQQIPFDPRQTSIAALAYLGDSVMEVMVREYLVMQGLTRSEDLNREALRFVTAASQAQAMERLEPHLTEEEKEIFKHGKNPGRLRPPAGVQLETYRIATGMEVLFARLYLNGATGRLNELFALGYQTEDKP